MEQLRAAMRAVGSLGGEDHPAAALAPAFGVVGAAQVQVGRRVLLRRHGTLCCACKRAFKGASFPASAPAASARRPCERRPRVLQKGTPSPAHTPAAGAGADAAGSFGQPAAVRGRV